MFRHSREKRESRATDKERPALTPAFEGVKKSTIASISVVRPSRRPRRGLLQDEEFSE
jgi:hypothetical protein